MQAARGFVGAAVELAACVKHGHDHFKRGLFGKFRVRIDRHAAPVVEHAEKAALLQRDLDESRMACDRLVHRIVDYLGEEMVQRVGVGAADIHAGAAAHWLEPLQHLDRGGGIVGLARRSAPQGGLGFRPNGFSALGRRGAEKVIHINSQGR